MGPLIIKGPFLCSVILFIFSCNFLYHYNKKQRRLKMNIPPHIQKEIIHILADIFPGLALYQFSSKTLKAGPLDGKQPALHLALDAGHIIGEKDILEAQKALRETSIPYTIYLFDLNAVAEHERAEIIKSAKAWKLGL